MGGETFRKARLVENIDTHSLRSRGCQEVGERGGVDRAWMYGRGCLPMSRRAPHTAGAARVGGRGSRPGGGAGSPTLPATCSRMPCGPTHQVQRRRPRLLGRCISQDGRIENTA